MSLLHVGSPCTTCHTIDFLPLTCNTCTNLFCKDHISTHGCLNTLTTKESNPMAGPSTWDKRNTCPVEGCSRLTIEAIGGVSGSSSSSVERGGVKEEEREEKVEDGERIAREVRCHACGEAFCVAHRQQSNHNCPGPDDYTARNDAALERKLKAQETLARTMPNRIGKIIPKPPPPRDIIRNPPPSKAVSSSTKSGESVIPAVETATPTATAIAPKTKSKAEKVYDIQVRKLRSLATPLDGKRRDTGEKRFFEWCVATQEQVEKWEESGNFEMGKKMERVWVLQETPTGKVLDLIITASKTPRPTVNDTSQALSLICLTALPDQPRQIVVLDTSKPAGTEIVEGSIVCLVKAWVEGGI